MKTSVANETEKLLQAITNRQTELESLTSQMISNADLYSDYAPPKPILNNEKQLKEWLDFLKNISSLSSSISKTI